MDVVTDDEKLNLISNRDKTKKASSKSNEVSKFGSEARMSFRKSFLELGSDQDFSPLKEHVEEKDEENDEENVPHIPKTSYLMEEDNNK